MTLQGKTLFITGASRGIGKAIALRAARDGANIVIAAKTAVPDPRLPGTVYSAAKEIEAAGGKALPVVVDVRDEGQVAEAVAQAVGKFGGLDILVNNASAISLTRTPDTPMKRYDLMMDINVRGSFVCAQICLPHLRRADNPHILTLSPPLNMRPNWFADHAAYTTSKYAMSMITYGLAHELRNEGIAVNALWPKTLIGTSALVNVTDADGAGRARMPDIMADAAYQILTQPSPHVTGQFFLDESVLRDAGLQDFSKYQVKPGVEPMLDLFVDA
ncbi:SDR family oxidoreductase [Cupriavidus sp. a3]|uniref:SDR family oxidoreductase n=1 Tax=Cupriavidus sp. a3 TaxID=3242158 RepID=UPI003D9C1F2C